MTTAKACPHIVDHPELDVLFVLDTHLHLTDAFVACKTCQATYLVELADMAADTCAFRISAVDPSAAHATIRSLKKGSCDINRAHNEVFSLASSKQPLQALLMMQNGRFERLVEFPAGHPIPNRSWRELPCDGAVIRAVQAS